MRRTAVVLATLLLATGCDPAPAAVSRPADPSGAPSESAPLDPANELAAIVWWETQRIGFGGVILGLPDPDPPVQPTAYRQLSVGTLDGRITAILALHWEWAHSSVTGPYGDLVLVANDTGLVSEVFTIAASDGSRRDLFSSEELIAAAAMGGEGAWVYYVELDRTTLEDSGLWRVPLAGGAPERIVEGPIGDGAAQSPSTYWMTADPLDDRVVVQSCFGQVRCTSTLVDPEAGTTRERTEVGWPLGGDGTTFFGSGLAESTSAWAWNVVRDDLQRIEGARRTVPVLTAGGWRFVRDELEVPDGRTVLVDADGLDVLVPGEDPPMTSIGTVSGDRGVVLPPGWVLRWPYLNIWWSAEDKFPESHGQLIEVDTGQRVDLERPELVVTAGADCPVPTPSQMPSGRRVGAGILELLDGRRTIRFGNGEDLVVVGIGWDALEASAGEDITVRGQPGTVALVEGRDGPIPAFSWTEGECAYTVWLPAGGSLDVAHEYAERY